MIFLFKKKNLSFFLIHSGALSRNQFFLKILIISNTALTFVRQAVNVLPIGGGSPGVVKRSHTNDMKNLKQIASDFKSLLKPFYLPKYKKRIKLKLPSFPSHIFNNLFLFNWITFLILAV
ncbi:hypothetical protein BpHYR1_006466 [Brachionus plicatilis]|uniref:Uncharacterized protein n=1 Tax=Brachionus plicatilis TaxID=10195 RepID=A0A3M7R9A7_BRAPC|nr:hypothetical protein BpHYR1_006466 [Brachionus plicatilis]